MLVWSTPYKGHSRVKMLLEDEQYLVVLERREKYCLLITAFYVDQEHRLEKLRITAFLYGAEQHLLHLHC